MATHIEYEYEYKYKYANMDSDVPVLLLIRKYRQPSFLIKNHSKDYYYIIICSTI